MSKIKLYIAMSLDGYISAQNDDLSFMDEYASSEMVGKHYLKFIEGIENIVMGSKTYDFVESSCEDEWAYPNHNTYVLTTKQYDNKFNVNFVNTSIKELIENLQKESKEDTWIVGGANIINQTLKEVEIDEIVLTIVPKLIGNTGVKLFNDNILKTFKLTDTKKIGGLAYLTMKKDLKK